MVSELNQHASIRNNSHHNLIGEKSFIQTSTYIPQVLTPCLKMDCHSKVARYLEVWGTEFIIKSLLVIQKGLKLAMSFIYFHPNCVLSMSTLLR